MSALRLRSISRRVAAADPSLLAIRIVAVLSVLAFALIWVAPTPPSVGQRFEVVHSDGEGYYAYLPAYLLEHDPSFRTWMPLHRRWLTDTFTREAQTHAYLDKYPIGEAVMLSPFFLVGHAVASIFAQDANGYSPAEQLITGLGGVAYFIAGLAVLRRSLLRYWSRRATAMAITTLVFGSNLFNYGAVQVTFSHIYSFFLCCSLIELSARWHNDGNRRWRDALLLGLTVGLILLVRNTNAILVLVFLLFGVAGWKQGRARLQSFVALVTHPWVMSGRGAAGNIRRG